MKEPQVFLMPLFACLCLLFSACGSSSASKANAVNLRAVVLQKSDVPQGFSPDPARYWTTAQAGKRDHIPPAKLESHGRVRSYSDSYSVSITSTVQAGGLVRAQSEIAQFKDPVGAHWYWSRLRKLWGKAYIFGATTLGANAGNAGRPVYFKPVGVPAVGDERAAFTLRAGGDEVDYQLTVVVWRRSNFVGMLRVRAVAEEYPLSKIVALARRMSARL